MRAGQVATLQRQLTQRGLDWCLVGGWGVDALLAKQTREHKDLDVLLPLAAWDGSMSMLAEEGFRLAYTWPESRPIPGRHPLLGEPIPSAFVLTHKDEREVDIHIYDEVDARIVCLWDTQQVLRPADLQAAGEVDGVPVRCMAASTQVVCHEGYELPPAHAEDVRLLQRLVQQHAG